MWGCNHVLLFCVLKLSRWTSAIQELPYFAGGWFEGCMVSCISWDEHSKFRAHYFRSLSIAMCIEISLDYQKIGCQYCLCGLCVQPSIQLLQICFHVEKDGFLSKDWTAVCVLRMLGTIWTPASFMPSCFCSTWKLCEGAAWVPIVSDWNGLKLSWVLIAFHPG